MIIIKKKNSFAEEFKKEVAIYKGKDAVTQLRGNLKSKILIIAPAPTSEDVANNLPLSDSGRARQLHMLLADEAGFDTQEDAIVMCGHPLPKKLAKSTVEPFRQLMIRHAEKFKMIMLIGKDNYRFYFGGGAALSMSTLSCGTLLFPYEELGDTPLFIFPDIDALEPAYGTGDERADYALAVEEQKCRKWIESIVNPHLIEHLKKYGK